MVKNLPGNAGDTGLIPGPGRSRMPQRATDTAMNSPRLPQKEKAPAAISKQTKTDILTNSDIASFRTRGLIPLPL